MDTLKDSPDNVEDLFQLLENVEEFYEKDLRFAEVASGGRGLNGINNIRALYQTFCKAYTIRLLEKYTRSGTELSLLLAIFQLLPNYRGLSIRERYEKFKAENPDAKFERSIKPLADLADLSASLRGNEKRIINKLAKQLEQDILKKGGRLSRASSVLDELAEKFPEGLPEELPADFLKRIRIEPFSNKMPVQDETSENDKIKYTKQPPNVPTEIPDERDKRLKLAEDILEETFPNDLSKELPLECSKYVNDTVIQNNLTDSDCERTLDVDTEQSVDNESIGSANEVDECESETYTDDEPTSVLPPGSPEDAEESSEELSGQDSLEEFMQSIEDADKAFWDKTEDEPDPRTSILPANKWKKRGMMLIICFMLGIVIWGFYSIFQEGGIKAVIKELLQDLAFIVAFIIAFIIAIPALGLLAVKVLDISYARKSNSKTRRSYTVQQIKDGILGKRIVFNSISDGSYVWGWGYKGNEKRFVSAVKIGGENTRLRFGFIEAEDGAEYLINVFIHNDNPNGYDAIAKHCRVKIHIIPSIPSKEVQVRGIISSDNARPSEYWDSVTFYNVYTPFKLVCLEPAKLYNGGIGQNGYSLSQKIKGSEGALIGYDYCDGEIPGGDGYESNILLKVKVVFDNNFIVKFKGHNYGPDGWQHTIEADVWDKVSFQIGYKNSSSTKEPQQNVTVSIDLPECLCYAPRSARLNIIPHPIFSNRLYDYDYDSLFLLDGLDIGDFNPGAGATIRFNAEVVDRSLSSGYTEALATVKISVGEVTNYDTVKIIINKE